MNRNCCDCKHWAGVDCDDVARCKYPLPEAVMSYLEFHERDDDNYDEIAGDCGENCPHWEAER